MDMIVDIINSIDAFVWGPPMIALLLGSHLFLTFRTRLHPAQDCPRPSSCR